MVHYPPPVEQRAIARILGTLDDKIALNRRMNDTLEALAQALFKDWFVDFGPVCAKIEGRSPYLPSEIWDLFPDALDNEGKPVGWDMHRLDSLVSLTKGRSYRSVELRQSSVALVTLKSFARGGGYREGGLKPYTGGYRPEQVVEPGELVIALTDVTQAAGVIGRPAIVLENASYDTLVASLDVGIVRPRDDRLTTSYVAQLLRTDEFLNHVYSHCTGTTVLHLSKDAFPTFLVRVPPEELLACFAAIVEGAFGRVVSNVRQNELLAHVCNALRPKLVSGELRVPDAAQVIGGVA